MVLIFYKGATSRITAPYLPLLHPFKIISSNSWTLPKDKFNMTDVSAYFFFDSDFKLMVHANLMNSPNPFIRFKTTGLSLEISDMNNMPLDSAATFFLMNGSTINLLLGEVIDLDSLNPKRTMINEKKNMLLALCFVGLALIVLAICVLSCVGEKKQRLDIIEAIETTEYSIFPNDK